MDITPLFKACIKTVRTRNKTFGEDKARVLRPAAPRARSGFVSVAKDIVAQITRLRDFLLEHRAAYLSCFNAFNAAGGDEMSEAERDQLDAGAQRIVNTCAHLIGDFRADNLKLKVPPQTREYMNAVVDLVDCYLKAVCKIHSELKALRVKRALDIRKLSRLELHQTKPTALAPPPSLPPPPPPATDESAETEGESALDGGDGTRVKPEAARRSGDLSESETALLSDEEQPSAEELQLLESENRQLYGELNNLAEEVKQIESKVLHIAELQEIFTEKVLQQEQDIDRVATTVVGATEDVKDANDQIRQAIQRNAGLRVYILFFLLVMSFSLLFLDWYND